MNPRFRSLFLGIAVFYSTAFALSFFRRSPWLEFILGSTPVFLLALAWVGYRARHSSDVR